MHYSAGTRKSLRWRRFRQWLMTSVLVLGTGTGALGLAQTPAPLLIQNVTPLDAHSGIMATQDVLLVNGRIADLGQELAVTPAATLIDGTGYFLSPGLWDMHVHLSYDDRLTPVMASLFLDYGITSVRDTGGKLERLLPVLEAYYTSPASAPRVFFAGPLLDGTPVVYGGEEGSGIGQSIVSVEEARLRVQTLHKAGVHFIKIYEMVSPDVFDAFVQEAEKLALPVAAHVPLSMLASEAAPRVQSLEHLRNIELDCAKNAEALLEERRTMLAEGREQDSDGMSLRASIHGAQRNAAIANEDVRRCNHVLASLRNTIQVPTARLNAMTQFPPFKAPDWPEALAALPATIRTDWVKAADYMDPQSYRVAGEWTLSMLPRLVANNVTIGAGTDTPIGWAIPGYSLHRELEILVKGGLDNQSALAAATLVPAAFFGLEEKMGKIAVGYAADLLLLEGNPLEDIRHSRGIRAVISKGEIVRDYR
ncbi:amidohydrolase family protein [Congregibacter litoralis]|uniref:Imidazolonepropionase n=1 Tax=Congregibacter litoralis KT71 TaxID=314285 RepID=A4AAM4_9GAMM|nr:amidohydrolase family protein [Congregibacter litoralis]EAQ97101.2 Imidazolonepropionase [Congregibacter litoralis KT71]